MKKKKRIVICPKVFPVTRCCGFIKCTECYHMYAHVEMIHGWCGVLPTGGRCRLATKKEILEAKIRNI